MDGMDGMGLDLRVGGGIEHLTVLKIASQMEVALQRTQKLYVCGLDRILL